MNGENSYTAEEFYEELRKRFLALLKEEGLLLENVSLTTKSLTPEEAIGITRRKDFPIIAGKDVMVQAECRGVKGQAFTDAPTVFKGTLEDVCHLNLESDSHNRGIFIAALNAVMGYIGKCACTVHCKNEGPELCSFEVLDFVKKNYGCPKIGLIGYQPSMLERLAGELTVRVCDLNQANIGQERYGVMVEDGGKEEVWRDICDWADLVLCTGSTICNGTIVNFIPLKDKTLFFGTTLAGAAILMDLPRLCFADHYQ